MGKSCQVLGGGGPAPPPPPHNLTTFTCYLKGVMFCLCENTSQKNSKVEYRAFPTCI